MKVVTICPAKINLFLSVGPLDRSKYHPINTIFQAISLSDRLIVQNGDQDQITCNWPGLPPENTLSKTLRYVKETVHLPPLDIRLEKNIPAESGLGGGSSDAAGLLRCLMEFAPHGLSMGLAHEIASAVGKDVPFFLVGGLAAARGYGEKLTPMADVQPRHLVIIKPEVGISSGQAYSRLDAMDRVLRPIPDDPWSNLCNDFEAVAPPICLEIKERLRQMGHQALLSGSGSAVFGVLDNPDAFPTEEFLHYGQVHLCQTLSRQESLSTTL